MKYETSQYHLLRNMNLESTTRRWRGTRHGLHPLESWPMKAVKQRRSQEHSGEFGVLYRCHRRAIFLRSWPPNQWPPAHCAATNALLPIDSHRSARHIPHVGWNLLLSTTDTIKIPIYLMHLMISTHFDFETPRCVGKSGEGCQSTRQSLGGSVRLGSRAGAGT
jgi:hypothetical protein